MKENKAFSVNVPSTNMVKETDYCGIYSGTSRDKSQIFEIFYGDLETAPLIKACPLNLENRVIHYLDLGSHTLVVGEITETYIQEDCLTQGKADPVKINPLIFTPGTREYYRLGEVLCPAFEIGKE